MPIGNTTSGNLVIPELWLDAVAGALPGLSVMGSTGAVRVETGLPGVPAGSPINIPYFGDLGRMADYADGAPIDVSQLTMTNEQATVVRSGIAFNLTDMAQRLAGYADPYGEATRQLLLAISARANDAAVAAANAPGLPSSMVLDVYSATTPARLDRDTLIEARMRWCDEQDGVSAITTHSVVVKRLLKLKDNDGMPLLRVISQNLDSGLIEFEGLPPIYVSDQNVVEFPITSAGTSPPVVTISGFAYGDFDVRVECTTGGALGTALVRWSIDGGVTWAASGVATAASVVLGTTGLTANFAAGTYATDNVYTCSEPAYSTLLLKRGAILFWTDPPNAEDFRDPLRKATISATQILHATHRYNRMPGRVRPGVVRIRHNG